MLEIVEDEQHVRVGEAIAECVACPQCPYDRRPHALGVAKRLEWYPHDAVGEILDRFRRELKREPRLSRAAGAGQRNEPVRAQEPPSLLKFPLASDQRRRLNRQGRQIAAAKRRELRFAELVKADRLAKIFQPVMTQVTDRHGRLEQLARRLREQNLPTVSGGGDPRRPVHIDPAVLAIDNQRLTRVQAHSHAERALRERRLCLRCPSDRLTRACKRDEEAITLRVDLHAMLRDHRTSDKPPELGESRPVPLRTNLLQHRRRPLDIGEQQRDRAGRQLPHERSMITWRDEHGKDRHHSQALSTLRAMSEEAAGRGHGSGEGRQSSWCLDSCHVGRRLRRGCLERQR